MNEEDFFKKYNLKKAENTKDYQIDDETLIKELQDRIERVLKLLELVKENKKDLNKYNQVIEDVLKGDK